MKNWSNKIQIAFLSVVVLMQLFVFLSPTQVQAQPNPIGGPLQLPIPGVNEPAATTPATKPLLPDAIDVTKQAPTELPVYNAGVDRSIQDYLCTPTGTGTDLYDCVDRLYRFGISAGAIIVVFFIIYAGYIYITGGEASKTKAKQTLYAAFTGMGIMLGSFILLNFINPSLVQIKTIQPPIFNAADLPSCEEIGFADKCLITSGGSAGQVSSGGGAYNGNWKESIKKYSAQYGLETCVADTIVKKESGSGNPNAIGHDHTVPPATKWAGAGDGKKASDSNAHDKFSLSSPPKHNLDWKFSHGIGLTQVTIFPYKGGNWPNADTPARNEKELIPGGNASKWYYPKDLVNPDLSAEITVRKMVGDIKRTGSLRAAFKAYNGGDAYADAAMKLYNQCKGGG